MFGIVDDYFGYNIESNGLVFKVPRIDETLYTTLGQAQDAIEAYQYFLAANM